MLTHEEISILAKVYANKIIQSTLSLKEDPVGVSYAPYQEITYWRTQLEVAFSKGFGAGQVDATKKTSREVDA